MESPLAEPSYLSAPQCLVHPSAHIQDGQILLRSGHFWDLPGWYGDINKSTSKSNTTHTDTLAEASVSPAMEAGRQLEQMQAAGLWAGEQGGTREKQRLSWSVKRLQLQFLELAAGRESFLFYNPPGNWAFLRWEFRLAGERRKYNLCIAWRKSESLATFK